MHGEAIIRLPDGVGLPIMGPTNGVSIGSAVFVCLVSNAMLYNALSVGLKNPKIASFPWDFITSPEEDRATVIGNMQKQFGKDRATHVIRKIAIVIFTVRTRTVQYMCNVRVRTHCRVG